eukprot:Nitzschia sp. Nitz4//scaffold47_size129522//114435//116789//NITZ4_003569-RA/size129522-processed-gene-0.22-mRNA-1//1//CDS//3329552854//8044//frame0
MIDNQRTLPASRKSTVFQRHVAAMEDDDITFSLPKPQRDEFQRSQSRGRSRAPRSRSEAVVPSSISRRNCRSVSTESMYIPERRRQVQMAPSPDYTNDTVSTRKDLLASFEDTSLFHRYQDSRMSMDMEQSSRYTEIATPSTDAASTLLGINRPQYSQRSDWYDDHGGHGHHHGQYSRSGLSTDESNGPSTSEQRSALLDRTNHFLAKAYVTLSATKHIPSASMVEPTYPQGPPMVYTSPLGSISQSRKTPKDSQNQQENKENNVLDTSTSSESVPSIQSFPFEKALEYPDPEVNLSIFSDDSSILPPPPQPPKQPDSLLRLASSGQKRFRRSSLGVQLPKSNSTPDLALQSRGHRMVHSAPKQSYSNSQWRQSPAETVTRPALPRARVSSVRKAEKYDHYQAHKADYSHEQPSEPGGARGYPVPTSYLPSSKAGKVVLRTKPSKKEPSPMNNIVLSESGVDSDEELTVPSTEKYDCYGAIAPPMQASMDSIFTMEAASRNNPNMGQSLAPSRCSTITCSVQDFPDKRSALGGEAQPSKKTWRSPQLYQPSTMLQAAPHGRLPQYGNGGEQIKQAFALSSPSTITTTTQYDRRITNILYSECEPGVFDSPSREGEVPVVHEAGGNNANRGLWVNTKFPEESRGLRGLFPGANQRFGGPGGRFPVDDEAVPPSCMNILGGRGGGGCFASMMKRDGDTTSKSATSKYESANEVMSKKHYEGITPRTAGSPDTVSEFPTDQALFEKVDMTLEKVMRMKADHSRQLVADDSPDVKRRQFRFPRRLFGQ